MAFKAKSYFLPYQIAWLNDDSQLKIWEKTRRGGMTYVQSYEDIRDAIADKWDVWFSSADETAAREYIIYCQKWAKLFETAAQFTGSSVFDQQGSSIQVFSVKFKNGRRITALTSNPSQFRSKGGKIVLDEFAWHRDQDAMWAAAEPATTWGYPLRIISTHNGKNCRFFRLLTEADRIGASVHKTTIYDAVEQGLVDKILRRKTSKEEKEKWLDDKKKRAGSTVWSQEYCCLAVDGSSAFYPYSLIEKAQRQNILCSLDEIESDFVLGMDIGRRRDLSVIWIAELIDGERHTRIIDVMENVPFRQQFQRLSMYLSNPNCRKACIDQTGVGEQIVEDAIADFGAFAVEPVRFNLLTKSKMAERMYSALENQEFLLPESGRLGDIIKEDFHSIRQEITPSGARRFSGEENLEDPRSHADYFWAAALCNYAMNAEALGKPIVSVLSATDRRVIDKARKSIFTGYIRN